MIAMALVCRPALLVADEPTTALDVTIQAQILQLVQSLQSELKMAMLLITHDLGIVANMADEVVVMYHGKVVESGTVEDIFRDPRHPYLKALMRAVPRFNMAPGERLTPIREVHASTDHLMSGRGRQPEQKSVGGEPLLEVRNLVKRFETRKTSLLGRKLAGEVRAVDDVSFHVDAGRMPGPGRRVRLRQDHHREDAAALGHARQRRDRVQRPRHAGATCWRCRGDGAVRLPAQGAVRVPGSVQLAQPAHDRATTSSPSRW